MMTMMTRRLKKWGGGGAKRPRQKGADDVEMVDRRGENSGNTSISGQIIAWIFDYFLPKGI